MVRRPISIAVAAQRDGGERRAEQDGCEDPTDLGAGELRLGEADADQDAADAIGEGAQRLDGDDQAGVSGQAGSASAWRLHH